MFLNSLLIHCYLIFCFPSCFLLSFNVSILYAKFMRTGVVCVWGWSRMFVFVMLCIYLVFSWDPLENEMMHLKGLSHNKFHSISKCSQSCALRSALQWLSEDLGANKDMMDQQGTSPLLDMMGPRPLYLVHLARIRYLGKWCVCLRVCPCVCPSVCLSVHQSFPSNLIQTNCAKRLLM